MSDSEEADFLVESWTLKGENVFKDDNKHQTTLKSRTTKTPKSKQAKKTNNKLKNAVMETKEKKKKKTKEKKKRKKKKKQKLALELDENFIFTQVSSTQAALTETSKAVNPRQKDKLKADNPAQDALKKSKRKKSVAFGLSPTFICVKRPKLACSSLKEMKAAGNVENCLQVTVKGHSHNQPRDNDSGEDMNSQDLFITQKTFRASPPEPSSSEDSQRPITASLQVFTQRDVDLQTAGGEIKQRPGESEKQMEAQVNLSKHIKVSEHVEASALNPYMDVPVITNHIPAAVSSSPPFVSQSTRISVCTRSTSTQTENFFTTELSSYMSFCYRSRVTVDLKPLDLSLPHRLRKDPCLSVKMSAIAVETSLLPGDDQNNIDVGTSGSPQVAHMEVKSESSGQSSKSEVDARSIDTTASSEDDQPCRKRDLIQVRAVQTKLNKPFFFKTKGEAQSPRPESPLMKLSQGRDVKIKKRH